VGVYVYIYIGMTKNDIVARIVVWNSLLCTGTLCLFYVFVRKAQRNNSDPI